MLLPQFTTRRLLLLIAGCAVLFFVLSLAVQTKPVEEDVYARPFVDRQTEPKHPWAVAVSVGIGSVVLTFLSFALFFQVSYVLAKLARRSQDRERPISPFARDTAPPTYVAPTNPGE